MTPDAPVPDLRAAFHVHGPHRCGTVSVRHAILESCTGLKRCARGTHVAGKTDEMTSMRSFRTWGARVPAQTAARSRTFVLACCFTTVACGGPVSSGSVACDDADSGGQSTDAINNVACSPAPCSLIGAWQFGGGEVACTGGDSCAQIVPPCNLGAIRFEPSGVLLRLTTVGWELACGFVSCGERVSGGQLSSILTTNYAAMATCGPNWDLSIVASSLEGVPICNLQAYAPCEGGDAVQVNYSRCTP